MRRVICREYHDDSQTLELRCTDGTLIDIDCLAVEDEAARNMYERSDLDYLLDHDPIGCADLILNGDVEAYLRNATDYDALRQNTGSFMIRIMIRINSSCRICSSLESQLA